MPKPLVSAVCGTWQRHEEVLGLIANLAAQSYRPLELVVVADGPDEELLELIADAERRIIVGQPADRQMPIVYAELGFHSSSYYAMAIAAAPFGVAQVLARGELQMWAADDERFEPDHVESLVALLLAEDVDFVYSQAECFLRGRDDPPMIVGAYPPRIGQITHALYRRELLDYCGFRTGVGSGTDWDQVQSWLAAGASCRMLPRVTMRHRIDKLGEPADVRLYRQPLRGLGGQGTYAGPRWHGQHPVHPLTGRLGPALGVSR